jgi:hypothetical protein
LKKKNSEFSTPQHLAEAENLLGPAKKLLKISAPPELPEVEFLFALDYFLFSLRIFIFLFFCTNLGGWCSTINVYHTLFFYKNE